MFPDLSSLLTAPHVALVFKIAVLIGLGAFLLFLFVVYRQVHSLNKIVRETLYGTFLEFFAFLLILAVLALFLLSLAIL